MMMLHRTIFGGLISTGVVSNSLAIALTIGTPLSSHGAVGVHSGESGGPEPDVFKDLRWWRGSMQPGDHPTGGRGMDGWLQRWAEACKGTTGLAVPVRGQLVTACAACLFGRPRAGL